MRGKGYEITKIVKSEYLVCEPRISLDNIDAVRSLHMHHRSISIVKKC